MGDYKVFNDNGEERTWEELYEDNVLFERANQELKQALLDIKEHIEPMVICPITDYENMKREILDIVNKALGGNYEKS